MSKTDTCLRCGKPGHTSNSCKLDLPPVQHTAEPFDGTERDMHRCSDCAKRLGCRERVPAITQPIRCARFKGKK